MSGPSGAVSFPPYAEQYHSMVLDGYYPQQTEADNTVVAFLTDEATFTAQNFLTTYGGSVGTASDAFNARKSMQAMIDKGNQFSNIASYDPSADLQELQDMTAEYHDYVVALDPETQWTTFVDEMLSKLEVILPTVADDDADALAFDVQQRAALARSYSRVAAGMADINAVASSAFPMALMMLEQGYNADLAKYRTERRLARAPLRAQMITQSVQVMAGLLTAKMTGLAQAVTMQSTSTTTAVNAYNQQIQLDVDYLVKELGWDFSILKFGGDVLGSMTLPGMPEGMTKQQQQLQAAGNGLGLLIPLLGLL